MGVANSHPVYITISLTFFMVFRRINQTFTFAFSFPTSKSESCVGSWTPLRRRWQLWHLSWLPTWVYLLQKVPSKQPEHLHDNLLSESFYGRCCLSKKENKSLRHPLNPLLCVWSPHVCICFCLFDLPGRFVSVFLSLVGAFPCVCSCVAYSEDCLSAFVSAGGFSARSLSRIQSSRENQIEIDGWRNRTGRWGYVNLDTSASCMGETE